VVPDARLPFDLAAIRDPATADCRFDNLHEVTLNGVPLTAFRVSYLSWESIDGTLQPIRIAGFAARPRAASGKLPAVVVAHGLGGAAEEESAVSLAARLGMFVVAYSGPGSGTSAANTSEGRPSTYANGYRLFDTLRDVRGSWFWAHTTAALRGLTCLAARSDVDAARLGLTGFSAGGIASLLGAGIDSRVRAAVPLSGALALGEATRSPTAWEHSLLSQCGLSVGSAEWGILTRELLDPARALVGSGAKVFMINGSTDEFFPLTAHLLTLRGLGGGDTRTSLIGNFDHGCYKVTGGEKAHIIEQRARMRDEGGQRAWFRHYLAEDPAYPMIPRPPVVTTAAVGPLTRFSATVDRPSKFIIEEVRLWWSGDNSYVYASVPLAHKSGDHYEKLEPLPLTATALYFVDVQYRTSDWVVPQRFSISSEPVMAASLVPHIRAIGNCL
jgi:dienelactone hydrolase